MTETICANFCRLHIFISFRALYFKVSDYGSRMNVGSVSIPASGFSALIWHGRPRVSGHRWHRGPVWPGQDIGRVQWPQCRESEESVPGHRSRDGPEPEPGTDSGPGTSGGRVSSVSWQRGGRCGDTAVLPPPTQSSSVILCILLAASPCLQSRIALLSAIIGHSRHHQETERQSHGATSPVVSTKTGTTRWVNSDQCGGCCVCVIRSKAEDQIQFWNSRASLCAKLFTLATIGAKYFFNC